MAHCRRTRHPAQALGLPLSQSASQPFGTDTRSGLPPPPRLQTGGYGSEDGDPVRRRQLLANLVVAAATAADAPLTSANSPPMNEATLGERLVGRLGDAMLGLYTDSTGTVPPPPPDGSPTHRSQCVIRVP
ncbi:hypothetical protein GCM10009864_65100 [Streptomyces lunalinharesii]|uniref:Uncharacterized protein n=1 Tax=Streptomyces lunalinharesii TaxID=333384 RepID=A0ABN3SSH5_9ACTN